MNLDTSKTQLYYLLLDLDEQQKQAKLEQIRQSQPELYQEVSALINAESSDNLDQLFHRTLQNSLLQQTDYSHQTVDKYQILHEIGRGGMGVVYAACRADKAFDQKLAIKFLQSDIIGLFSHHALFDEAQLLAKLNHPHIAKVFDGGIHDGDVYIVMEQVEGPNFKEYIEQITLSRSGKLKLFVQICSAVEHAHQNGILHGDLKPENVLINHQHQIVKLIDFNLAPTHSYSYSYGIFAYSQQFASPEQQAGQAMAYQSDVYSLGQILLWLFPNESALSDLKAIQNHATQAEISQRYHSVEQLKVDIEAIIASKPISLRRHLWFYPQLCLLQRRPINCALLLAIAAIGTGLSTALFTKHNQLEQQKLMTQRLIEEMSQSNSPHTVELLTDISLDQNRSTNDTAGEKENVI
ncbi:serine/threonine protein kinase [Vibrio japonicus]|uniref:Serine/threonine protein kinase n=1 Tax=Vibrio japonicus TaxID=1824638 RepID=A0ABY5LF54_9VIBR|nr:serine/threonine-protein kinase [Vibrio japonicus]UUM30673.1 serine/threonine protein kinase [Vibrio japonicus]